MTVAEGSESLIVLEQGAELCISADAPVDELPSLLRFYALDAELGFTLAQPQRYLRLVEQEIPKLAA